MGDNGQDTQVLERLRDCFDQMVVYKDLKQSNFISSFKLPSFMRDWVLKRFQDDEGVIDVDGATNFIKEFIPKKEDWKSIKSRIVNYQEQVKFLAKVSIEIDIKTGEIAFSLPDFGLGFKETVIPKKVWDLYGATLRK
jgi:ATP-dependent Lon protease